MRNFEHRLRRLENNSESKGQHWIFKWASWDDEAVLDHYGRDKIAPTDTINWLIYRDDHLDRPMRYPRGYFDDDGRWAEILKARGIAQ